MGTAVWYFLYIRYPSALPSSTANITSSSDEYKSQTFNWYNVFSISSFSNYPLPCEKGSCASTLVLASLLTLWYRTDMINKFHMMFSYLPFLIHVLLNNRLLSNRIKYCIQGYFCLVFFSPLHTCTWFRPILNSSRHSTVYDRYPPFLVNTVI